MKSDKILLDDGASIIPPKLQKYAVAVGIIALIGAIFTVWWLGLPHLLLL